MRPLAATWTAGAVCALIVAAASAPAPAAAGEEKTIDQVVIDSFLRGIGLERDRPATVEYHERAPLVIPPTKMLPPPENSDAVAANPAWPKDPDIKRQKEAARIERTRNISEEREREQNPLPPDQIGPRGGSGSIARADDGYQASPNGVSGPMTPSELGSKGPVALINKMFGGDNDRPVRFTGEPKRIDLTEPPPGYQTPSPEQPYGPGRAAPPKPTDDYLTRGEVKSGS
jgi:hypothetical protein